MKLKRIHVNQHNIRANNKDDGNRPIFSAKVYNGNFTGQELEINGPSRLVYRKNNPLSCGARVWIETHSPVKIINGKDECVI